MKLHIGGIVLGAVAMLGLVWLLRLVGAISFGDGDRARTAALEAQVAALLARLKELGHEYQAQAD